LPAADNGSGQMEIGGGMDVAVSATGLNDGIVRQYTTTFSGVPTVGFMVRTFRNDYLRCADLLCRGNYGGAFPHMYRAEIYSVPGERMAMKSSLRIPRGVRILGFVSLLV